MKAAAVKKKHQLNFSVAPHIASKLKTNARKAGMTLTSYVRYLLAEAVG